MPEVGVHLTQKRTNRRQRGKKRRKKSRGGDYVQPNGMGSDRKIAKEMKQIGYLPGQVKDNRPKNPCDKCFLRKRMCKCAYP